MGWGRKGSRCGRSDAVVLGTWLFTSLIVYRYVPRPSIPSCTQKLIYANLDIIDSWRAVGI